MTTPFDDLPEGSYFTLTYYKTPSGYTSVGPITQLTEGAWPRLDLTAWARSRLNWQAIRASVLGNVQRLTPDILEGSISLPNCLTLGDTDHARNCRYWEADALETVAQEHGLHVIVEPHRLTFYDDRLTYVDVAKHYGITFTRSFAPTDLLHWQLGHTRSRQLYGSIEEAAKAACHHFGWVK